MPLRQTGLTLARRLGYENADDSEKTPPGGRRISRVLGYETGVWNGLFAQADFDQILVDHR
jgi:hypothetical protein